MTRQEWTWHAWWRQLAAAVALLWCTQTSAAGLVDPEVAEALRANTARPATQRVIVQYRDADAPQQETAVAARARRNSRKLGVLRQLEKGPGAGLWRQTHDFSELPMNAIELRSPAALDALLADPDVEAVFADRPVKLYTDSSVTLVRQPPVANVMHRTGAGQTIAVIDTGVNYTLAGLGSCTAPGVGANCKVVASYYTATSSASPPSGSGLDDIGHGSEVAQVALAVAPDARIAAIGVFNGTSASSTDIIAGINWAIKDTNRTAYNIVAINLSLGDGVEHTSACTTLNSPFASPIKSARNKGVVVVAATGNEAYSNGIGAPACVTEAIAVGAVYSANWGGISWSNCTDSSTAADMVTCFSDSSTLLDIWAPGAFFNLNGSNIAGTSFAAPMVAGAVAVLKAQFSSDTVSAIETRLLTSATPITDTRNGLTRPRLDLVAEQGAPGNDAFASAASLSGSSAGASAWNYNATLQSGEPQHAGTPGGHSVWWTWTAPSDGLLTLTTAGSDFNTLLALYTGSAVSSLTAIGANDDDPANGTTSALTTVVSAGQTYRIAVDGKNSAQGAITLGLSLGAPSADLAVTLSASPATPTVGAGVTLTAQVSNAGPFVAAGSILTVTLPSGLTYVSDASGCSASSGTVSCALGTLAVGASQTVVIETTAQTPGTLTATASVSTTTGDANATNNLASAGVAAQNPVVTSGDPGGDSDAPLPAWALATLSAGLWSAMRRRRIKPLQPPIEQGARLH